MVESIKQLLQQVEEDMTDFIVQLDEKQLALDTFQMRYQDFMDKLVKKIVNEEIVETIKWRMKMWKFSPKIIDTVRLEDVRIHGRSIEAWIICDYTSKSGFDVAKAREEGTVQHWVEPISAKSTGLVINWQTGAYQPSSISAKPKGPKALHWSSNGTHYFSKGHWVSGMPRLKLIDKTIKQKRKIVKERIKSETKAWIRDILS